jgi:AraC-like DNA-binding protein/mannose-6-phosphate isomerase-like protein (cupin superfamily)
MRADREMIQLPSGHSFRVLRWSRNLRDVDIVLGPGETRRIVGEGTHWHHHVEMELTLFTSGAGTRFVGDHIGPFTQGDLVLLGENLPHYWHTEGRSSGLSLQWCFPQGHAFWSFPETLALAKLFKQAGRGIRYTGKVMEAVGSTMNDIANATGADRLGLLLRLLAALADAPTRNQSFLSARVFSLNTASAHQQAVGDAVRHLLANFRDELRLDDVLKLTGMSRPTFCRQFKKHTGQTFSEFVTRVRLDAACRELVESDRSVLEIALLCGFTQVSFFNRIFRRRLGCNPTGYRTRRRGDRPGVE